MLAIRSVSSAMHITMPCRSKCFQIEVLSNTMCSFVVFDLNVCVNPVYRNIWNSFQGKKPRNSGDCSIKKGSFG